MAQTEFERVEADLAAMKAVCQEPAVPTEEIVPSLIIAACGAALLPAVFFLSAQWIRGIVIALSLLGAAVYLPWKRRVLRQDAPRRGLEARELWASLVAIALFVPMTLWLSRALPNSWDAGRSLSAGLFLVFGLALTVYYGAQPRRRYYLGTGVGLAAAGLLFPFTEERTAFCAVLFGMMVVIGLSNAICLSWAARRERSEHGGH